MSPAPTLAPPRQHVPDLAPPAVAPADPGTGPSHEGSLPRGILFGLVAVLPFWLTVLWVLLRVT